MKVFIEAEKGSHEKNVYDEATLAWKTVKRSLLQYPYPYGFILGTATDDGEAVDCYIITEKKLQAGTTVDCEVGALLEFFESDEIDHKVVAFLSEPEDGVSDIVRPDNQREILLNTNLRKELTEFITGIWKKYPEIKIKVGELQSKKAAIEYVKKNSTGELLAK